MSLPRRSHTEIAAESTRRSTARASISATASTLPCSASAAPSSSSASDTSAASRMLAYRRTFSHAAAALPATTSRTCRSVSSNWSSPSRDRTIAPIGSPSDSIGATIIDSSTGSLPGTSTAYSSTDASGMRRARASTIAPPATPSPTRHTRSAVRSSSYSAIVPSWATGIDHVARLGEQVEAAGVVVDQARQLGDDGPPTSRSLWARVIRTDSECSISRCASGRIAAPVGRGGGGATGSRERRRRAGCDQLRGLQLGRLELVRRAHRPDQRSEPLVAGHDGSDDDGVAAVPAAHAPLGALRQDRRQPRDAQAVRADPGARPARVHRRRERRRPGAPRRRRGRAARPARGRVLRRRRRQTPRADPASTDVTPRSRQRKRQGGAHIAHRTESVVRSSRLRQSPQRGICISHILEDAGRLRRRR